MAQGKRWSDEVGLPKLQRLTAALMCVVALQARAQDTTAPGAPTSLAATSIGVKAIALSWAVPDDDVEVTAHQVFRNGALIATVNAAGHAVDTGLSASTTYTYTVKALDAAGNTSAASAAITATTLAAPNLSPNPVAMWSFNENAGAYVIDSSATSLVGTASVEDDTAPTWSPLDARKDATGLKFDGDDDFIDVGNPTALQLTGSISVAAWVKADELLTDTDYQIVGKSAQGDLGWSLRKGGSGRFYFSVAVPGGCCNYAGTWSNTAPVVGQWYHVVGVYTAGSSPSLTIYVNGVLDRGGVNGNTPLASTMRNGGKNVCIGSRQGTSWPWKGSMDEIRIYNVPLTAAQVASLYSSANIDNTKPIQPGDVTAAMVSATQVNLSWAAASDNVGVTGYRVYRNGTLIGSPTGLTFTDNAATNGGQTSVYKVSARDAAGNESVQVQVNMPYD